MSFARLSDADPSPKAACGGAGELHRVQPSPRPSLAQDRRPGHVVRRSAGLGVATRTNCRDCASGRSHGGDSALRGSDLAESWGRRALRGASRARRSSGPREPKRAHVCRSMEMGRSSRCSPGAAPTRCGVSRRHARGGGRAEAVHPSRDRASPRGRSLDRFHVALAQGRSAQGERSRCSTSTPERALSVALRHSTPRWSRRELPRSRARSPEQRRSSPIVSPG